MQDTVSYTVHSFLLPRRGEQAYRGTLHHKYIGTCSNLVDMHACSRHHYMHFCYSKLDLSHVVFKKFYQINLVQHVEHFFSYNTQRNILYVIY